MPNFFTDFIKRKFIDPVVNPLTEELHKKDGVIMLQQDKIEKAGSPIQFATNQFLVGSPDSSQNLFRFKKFVDFKTLRSFSEQYDVARACINRRKRQVDSMKWTIQATDPNDKPEKYKKQIDEITKFFKNIGGKNARFREFIDELVEDILVLDAGVIWKDKTKGEQINKLITVDGETIRLRVMSDGSTPEPPDIAYQQFINGQKVSEFTTDEMLYVMLNPRSNTPYGLAPLETLILGVDAALRSQLYNLKLLTEGNAPEGFFSLPETWSPQQLKEFETYFNGTIAGNPRFQQRIKFMPGGKGVGYVPTKKPDEMRFLEYEKWLLMKCCAMFDVPPEEIGFTETVNKSTGEQQNQIAKNSGLEPMLQVLKENFDLIIQEDLGCPFLHLDWQSSDVKDEKKDAEISQILFPTGAISVDEWRVKNGLDPIGLEHYIQTPAGPILVKDFLEFGSLGVAPIEETPEPAPKEKPENNKEQKIEELLRWKKKAITTIKEGKKPKKFDTDKIDKIEVQLIEAQLYLAKSKEDVRKIFEKFLSSARQEYIFEQSAKLKEDISKTLREYEKPVVAKT